MPDPSPFWQNVLLLGALLYLVFEVARGWRRGIVRHAISLFALVVAGIIGYAFAWILGPVADVLLPFAPLVNRLVVGLAAGIGFYIAAAIVSSVLFKSTAQQTVAGLKLVYGAGGALCGLIFGLIILWGGITIVRALGAMAEGQMEAAAADHHAAPVLDQRLAALKQSLEQGAAGRMVEKVDILPVDAYRILMKLTQVTSSPAAMERFISYPGTEELMAEPAMAALLADPGVAHAAESRNYLALLTNRRVIEAINDPPLRAKIAAFDLEKALDYALGAPSPSPSPSHE